MCHYIIQIAAEVLAPDGTCVNNGKFHSLVRPPGNIPPIITELTGTLNGDMDGCQEFLIVRKEFIIFLKEKLDEQGEIDQGGASHLTSMAHNRQRFDMYFLMTELINNFEAVFIGHMSMLPKQFQLYTMSIDSKSCRNYLYITIPDNYKLGTLYCYVTRCTEMGSVTHRAPVDVATT